MRVQRAIMYGEHDVRRGGDQDGKGVIVTHRRSHGLASE